MFYRARNSVERFDGVGIGLFSSKKIIGSHGGTITLKSAEHAGSTFTIRLPLRAGVETAIESGLEAALPK